MTSSGFTSNFKRQEGAILFISLIILLLVTIVAIGSTRLSTAGQRISLNYQVKNSTFQLADSALVQARDALSGSNASQQARSSTGFVRQTTTENSITHQNIRTNTVSRRAGITSGNSFSTDGSAPGVFMYTTEATASVDSMNIVTVLEEGFIKHDVGN